MSVARSSTWLRAFVVWLLLLLLAVMNGAFREAFLNRAFGVQAAHVAGTVLLAVLVVILALLSRGWIGARNERDAFLVGVLWTVLVLAFEFLAGHFLFGRSWQYLLADYDLLAGRVWVAVPIVPLFAPLCIAQLMAATR